MPQRFDLYERHPQPRSISEIVSLLEQGSLMVYPTDTVYAIGCDLFHKQAVERLRGLKRLANTKPLTFLCASLSGISAYAHVSDHAYRFIRALIPGPYTFLLPATKLVPKLVLDPKRKTTGIRVPDHPICQALLAALGHPIISTSAQVSDLAVLADGHLNWDAPALAHLIQQVEVVIEDGLPLGSQVSTVIDLTTETPHLVRRGAGYAAIADLLDEEPDT